MKRDMDLVRRILIEAEKADAPYSADTHVSMEHGMASVAYHVELMQAHGLIDARVVRDMSGEPVDVTVTALTWDGCDYLDAIRNDGVWAKTKQAVRDAVGDTTMSAIKQAASLVSMQLIKAQLGM